MAGVVMLQSPLGALLRVPFAIYRTEREWRRLAAKRHDALRNVARAAEEELLRPPLLTKTREAFRFWRPDPPLTVEEIAEQMTAAQAVFPGVATQHIEFWSLIAEELRERHDAFLSLVSLRLADLADEPRAETGRAIVASTNAAQAALLMERKFRELVWRESQAPETDPLARARLVTPVREAMADPSHAFREAITALVSSCRRLRELSDARS